MTATQPSAHPTAWTPDQLQNPHAAPDKAAKVNAMFTAIAPAYDLNNRLHSLGIDQLWRNTAVKMAQVQPTDRIVDVACGTGDLTLKFARKITRLTRCPPAPAQVLGIDFTHRMLPIAAQKSAHAHALNPQSFINGDALELPLPDASADVLSIAFGIRNVADPAAAIREFFRVLRPAGRLIILEFSQPPNPLVRSLYNFYFHHVMPFTCTLISRDRTGAYTYLPKSVNTFITPQTMQNYMQSAGFADITTRSLTLGVCVCYRGLKP